ncbi:MAG: helix-turn-helix domain-containing protein [Myxococcaceae bacterium]|nr:helix-turn-helix domain-containing protein [Myxococcaceae bacterium]
MEPSSLLPQIGLRVRSRRRERALTVKGLAEAAGLSQRFVSEVEAGRANISVVNLAALAQALGASVTSLLDDGAHAVSASSGVVSLLGLRGAGKSTIGRGLAQKLGVGFFELDRLVEVEAGMSLEEIFAIHGEDYFRRLELMALRRFLDSHSSGVLATGGGLVTSPASYRLLLERSRTVWLQASPKDHMARVVKQGDLRPMRNRPHAMTELKRRLKEREPLYAKAHRVCPTSKRKVDEVVDDLARWAR